MHTRKKLTVACALLVMTLAVTVSAQPAFRGRNLPNPFYAMDTGTIDAKHQTIESQVLMLKELGYAGGDVLGTAGIPERLKLLRANGMELYSVYTAARIDGGPKHDANLPAVIEQIEGSPAVLWMTVVSNQHKPSTTDGDEQAVAVLREIADMAAKRKVEIALYPHVNNYVERVEDAVRLAKIVDRPNLGVTFNLCHWLAKDSAENMRPLLELAAPYLKRVSINGADRDGKGWKQLIQTLDRGTFDVYELVAMLRDYGYDGPIGLQGYGIGGDVHDNLSRSMGAWKKMNERYAAEWVDLTEGVGLNAWRDPRGDWANAGAVSLKADDEILLGWQGGAGCIVNGPTGRTNNILTTREHDDVEAHVEFMVPKGSNSGVYFQARYEIQVLDSWGVEQVKHGDCGGIYQRWDNQRKGEKGYEGIPPRVNAARPPGEWQSFDIVFRAPRFDAAGQKTANAKFIKVVHNGGVVHEREQVTGPTRASTYNDEKPLGPIMLQGDHGPVAYRNLRIRPLLSSPTRQKKNVTNNPLFERILAYDFGKSRKDFLDLDALCQGAPPDVLGEIEGKLLAALQSPKASLACKQRICKILYVYGSEQSVPVLTPLLVSPRENHMARYVFMGLPYESVDRALIAALAKTKGLERIGIVNTLGDRGCAAAVPALAKLISVEDAALTKAVIAALGRIGTAEAEKTLREAVVPKALETHRNEARLECADGWWKPAEEKQAEAVCRDLIARLPETNEHFPVLTSAYASLCFHHPRTAPLTIKQLLQSPHIELQHCGASLVALPQLEWSASGLDELFTIARGKASPMEGLMLYNLAERENPAVALQAVKSLRSEDETTRKAAVYALGQVGDPTAVPELVKVVSADPALGQAVAEALGLMPGDKVDAALLRELRAAQPAARAGLIPVLTARRAPGAAPDLLRYAQEDDVDVRRAALKALGELAAPGDAPKLIDVLVRQKSAGDRSRASRAILALAKRAESAEACSGPLLAALPKAPAASRPTLFELLGKIGGDRALPALRQALNDENDDVRLSAIRALGEWPGAAPLDNLLAQAEKAPRENQRRLALRGYIRLLGLPHERPPEETQRKYQAALALAPQPEDKQLLVDAVAAVPDVSALKFLEQCMKDPALKAKASAAYLNVAQQTCGLQPREIAAALREQLKSSPDPGTGARIEKLLGTIEKFDDSITAWTIAVSDGSPQFTQAGKDGSLLIDVAFPPEKPQAAGVSWRPLTGVADSFTQFITPGAINLGEIVKGENCCVYLRTSVVAPQALDAVLELGSDDGVKAWLNGKVVHANNAARAHAFGSDRAKVRLSQGANALLLKVTQVGGEWGVSARLRTPDGNIIPDLRAIAK